MPAATAASAEVIRTGFWTAPVPGSTIHSYRLSRIDIRVYSFEDALMAGAPGFPMHLNNKRTIEIKCLNP